MKTQIAVTLLCTVAPVALLAQQVTLESPDQFISVDGEITGYNGVMLRVETSVGAVSIPASEVICFGEACFTTIADNAFGLTADSFIAVLATATEEPAAPQAPANTDFSIGFGAQVFGAAYTAIAGAFAADAGAAATVSGDGAVALSNANTGGSANVTPTGDLSSADITVAAVSLAGTAPQAFASPADWAGADTVSNQLIGLQSFSVIAAPTAGIDSISLNDLARVYAGEVTNWTQIGGADVSVLPLQLPTTSPLRAQIETLVMEPSGKTVAGNVLTMGDEAGISASINQFPGSISIVSSEGANADLTIPVSGSCGLGVMATPFNIVSGDYPLISPVMVNYGEGAANPLMTEMLDFAATADGQALATQFGLISYAATLQDSAIKNSRLGALLDANLDDVQRNSAAQMFQVLFNADRLSPTLTGGPASGPEGGWNRAMLRSVIAAMSDPANAGREIIFVGKGASTAGSQAALEASQAAALEMQNALSAVAGDLIASAGFTVTSYGFGDVSPATCTDGQVAGSEYTRIEVWIR